MLFFISGLFVASVFNPVLASELVEDSWNSKTSMSQTRMSLGVVGVNGKVYAIGGFTAVGYLDLNEQYDPVTDIWTTLTPMPTPRNGFAIAAYEGKIYCIGGITNYKQRGYYNCDVTEVYDTVTDSWSTKASLPVNGSDLQAHVIGGQIFVIVGSDLFMYDPVTDLWTKKTSLPTTPFSKISFVLTVSGDDKIMVIGDFPIDRVPSAKYEQKVMIYNPKTDVWGEGTKPPFKVAYGGAVGVTTGVSAPQKAYILGIYNTTVYDPSSCTWSAAEDMLTPRSSFGVGIVDDLLYVVGGAVPYTGVQFLAVNEQYVPINYGTPLTDVPSTATVFSLSNIIVVVLVLTVGVVASGLFFYNRKRKRIHLEISDEI